MDYMMRLNKTAATRLLLRRTGYQICCLSDDETYNAVQYSSMLLDYSMSHESHVCTFKIDRETVFKGTDTYQPDELVVQKKYTPEKREIRRRERQEES